MPTEESSTEGQGLAAPEGEQQDFSAQVAAALESQQGADTSGSDGGSEQQEFAEHSGEEVQPSEGDEAQSEGGQGLIEPYVADVDPRVRPIVEEKLEAFRKDADANANAKIEKVSTELKKFKEFASEPEQLETPVALYMWLMEQPLEALDWMAQAVEGDMGLDVRSTLMDKWGKGQPQNEQPQETAEQPEGAQSEGQQQGSEADRPLTRAELEEEFKRREQEAQQRAQQQQMVQKLYETLDGVLVEQKFNLPANSPEREVILRDANRIYEQGQAKTAKEAISLSAKATRERLETAIKGGGSQQPSGEPRTAQGGDLTSGLKQINASDKNQRIALIEQIARSQQSANA